MRSLNYLLALVSVVLSFSLVDKIFAVNYYVSNNHPKANDANYGIQSNLPIKSISAALLKAFPGDTVWVDSGTYRETILIPRGGFKSTKSISIRALPKADVRIKGSDPVSGWVKHFGSVWKRLNWEVNSQQVFIDGVPLQQIGMNCPLQSQIFEKKPLLPFVGKGVGDVHPGSFFYDQKEKIIYIQLHDGSDPNRHLVEASVRDFVIQPKELNFIVLERLNFSHSNLTSKGLIMGMVNVWGNFWTITDCTLDYADFAGISVIGTGHKITNCKFNNNGNLGISLNGSDDAHKWAPVPNRPPQNIVLSGNETNYNNYRKFELSWQNGGIKAAVSCNGVRVTSHKAIANYGVGIWFDAYCRNITISRSTVTKNLIGIFYEISDQAVIANNLVTGNEYQGIYVAASSEVTVMNNTLDDNGFGIVIHGLPRAEHPTLNNNRVLNNIVSESRLVDLVFYKNAEKARGNSSDYNLYYRRDKGVKISWTGNRDYGITHTNLRTFAKASGQETHSLTADPRWVNSEAGNYALKAGSPALGAGMGEKAVPGQGTRRRSYSSGSEGGGSSTKVNIGAF